MTINEYAKEFAGKPVFDYKPGAGLADLDTRIYRIAAEVYEPEVPLEGLLSSYLQEPGAAATTGLVIGGWEESYEQGPDKIIKALIAAQSQLPMLSALFLGDMTYEDCEISWIIQTDVAPLIMAFPALTEFKVRGANSLAFNNLSHPKLTTLTIESGGLGADVVTQVLAAKLPALWQLELWLGVDDYGGNTTVATLEPLFTANPFPGLKVLGLRNSQITDEIAAAVVAAPVMDQLTELDLSMGTLSDKGAQALLKSIKITKLKRLVLHHNYLSDPMLLAVAAWNRKFSGVEVVLSGQYVADDEDPEWRYPAVTE